MRQGFICLIRGRQPQEPEVTVRAHKACGRAERQEIAAAEAADVIDRPESRRSALGEPYWRPAFGHRSSEIVGAIVLEPDGRWRATCGGRDFGIFGSADDAQECLRDRWGAR
jgi:hypothetical protein